MDLVRNTDVTNANKARLNNADRFALGVLTEITSLGLLDQLDHKMRMVRELNKHGIKTRRGGEWTRTQYDRLHCRIKIIEQSDEPFLPDDRI